MRMKSKLISCLLIVGIIFGSFGSMVYGNNEDGINKAQETQKASTWAINDVKWADSYKMIPKGSYESLKKSITREEFVSLLVKLYEKLTNKEIQVVKEKPFNDTESVDVSKAYSVKIIDRVEDNKFLPKDNITREEMVKGFYNTIKAAQPDLSLDIEHELKFKDIDNVSNEAISAITYLNGKNILNGKSEEILAPKAICTREEAIALAKRVYEKIIRETGRASKGIMYRIYDDNSEVYLLGSIHLANSDIYPLSTKIEKAYKEAEYLGVEANILDQSAVQSYLAEVGIYKDGTTIKDHVSEETYKKLNNVLEEFGMNPNQFDYLKPWYVTLALSGMNITEGGELQAVMGVDMYFLTRAMENKDIKEIEGAKFQFDMFNGLSPELQEHQLLELLNGLEKGTVEESEDNKDTNKEEQEKDTNENETIKALKSLLKTWKNGNVEEFEKALGADKDDNSDEFTKEYNTVFWKDRDRHMTDTVIKYLKDENDSTYFIVVGAGHLIGENGIINLLTEEGYSLEQVK